MDPDVVHDIDPDHRGPRQHVHPQRVHDRDPRGVGHDPGTQRASEHDPGDREDHDGRDQCPVVMVAQGEHDQDHDRERGPRPPRHQGSGRPVDLPLAGQILP